MDGGTQITRDFLLDPPKGRPIHAVMAEICHKYGLTYREMVSDRRSRRIAWPRQEAMYICSRESGLSLPAIGRHFGDRHHTTVMHAIEQVEARIKAGLLPDYERRLQSQSVSDGGVK